MPKFQVETDKGMFEIEIDKEKPTQLELQNAIQQQLISERPTFGEALKAEIPEIVGGIIGETAGIAAGGLVGRPITGGIVGAGLGQATGEIVKRGIERPIPFEVQRAAQLGAPGLIPTAAGAPIAAVRGLQTPEDIRAAVGEFALGAGASVIGAGLFRGAQKLISPFKQDVIQSMSRLRQLFHTVGGEFTPAQLTENRFLDFLEELVEGSYIGQAEFRLFKEQQQKSILSLSRKVSITITNGLGDLSDEAVGSYVLTAVKQGRKMHQAIANRMYSEVDEVLQQAIVPTIQFKQIAQKLTEQLQRIKGFISLPEVTGAVRATLQQSDNLSFGEAHAIRSALLAQIRDLAEVPGKGQARSMLSKLVTPLDEAMEQAGKNLSGDASTLWRNTNKFYKEGKEIFENDFLTDLIIKNKYQVSKIGDKLFKPGNLEEIRQVRTAIKKASELDPSIKFDDTWNTVKSGYYEGLINRNTDRATTTIQGNKLIKELTDRKTIAMLKEILPQNEINLLNDFAKVVQTTQAKTGAVGAPIAIRLAQFGAIAGALGSLAYAVVPGQRPFRPMAAVGGATILLGPALVGKLMTTPSGIKLLTDGYKLGIKGDIALRRLPNFLSRLSFTAGNITREQSKRR